MRGHAQADVLSRPERVRVSRQRPVPVPGLFAQTPLIEALESANESGMPGAGRCAWHTRYLVICPDMSSLTPVTHAGFNPSLSPCYRAAVRPSHGAGVALTPTTAQALRVTRATARVASGLWAPCPPQLLGLTPATARGSAVFALPSYSNRNALTATTVWGKSIWRCGAAARPAARRGPPR